MHFNAESFKVKEAWFGIYDVGGHDAVLLWWNDVEDMRVMTGKISKSM